MPVNGKRLDGLWLTAVLSACALVFFPAQAALPDEPRPQRLPPVPIPPALAQESRPVNSSLPTALRRRPTPRRRSNPAALVTHEFVDADIVDVIKVLARAMGRNVYIGPGVDGRVTMDLKSVPADGALALILQQQERDIRYKLIGYNTLFVAQPDKIDCLEDEILGKPFAPRRKLGVIRQEFLLESASAAKVMGFLQGEYGDVEFIPHPTMNGFYAVGSREDILKLKEEVPKLDEEP